MTGAILFTSSVLRNPEQKIISLNLRTADRPCVDKTVKPPQLQQPQFFMDMAQPFQ